MWKNKVDNNRRPPAQDIENYSQTPHVNSINRTIYWNRVLKVTDIKNLQHLIYIYRILCSIIQDNFEEYLKRFSLQENNMN